MNKKIVFVIVVVECFLAVLLISIFGQAIFAATQKHLAHEVYFTYQDGTKIEDNVHFEYEVSQTDALTTVKLHWVVGPEETSNKQVSFAASKPDAVAINEEGVVTFFDEVDVTITIFTMDGSNHTDTLVLVPKRNVGGDVDI